MNEKIKQQFDDLKEEFKEFRFEYSDLAFRNEDDFIRVNFVLGEYPKESLNPNPTIIYIFQDTNILEEDIFEQLYRHVCEIVKGYHHYLYIDYPDCASFEFMLYRLSLNEFAIFSKFSTHKGNEFLFKPNEIKNRSRIARDKISRSRMPSNFEDVYKRVQLDKDKPRNDKTKYSISKACEELQIMPRTFKRYAYLIDEKNLIAD